MMNSESNQDEGVAEKSLRMRDPSELIIFFSFPSSKYHSEMMRKMKIIHEEKTIKSSNDIKFIILS